MEDNSRLGKRSSPMKKKTFKMEMEFLRYLPPMAEWVELQAEGVIANSPDATGDPTFHGLDSTETVWGL